MEATDETESRPGQLVAKRNFLKSSVRKVGPAPGVTLTPQSPMLGDAKGTAGRSKHGCDQAALSRVTDQSSVGAGLGEVKGCPQSQVPHSPLHVSSACCSCNFS